MVYLIIPFILLILLLIAQRYLSKNNPQKSFSYSRKKPLSDVESILFYRLQKALPDFNVLSQVQLSRFLLVRSKPSQTALNRIDRLSVDFLICAKDFTIICAIELDDSTHNKPRQQERDARKNAALESAGISLIRYNVRNLPDAERIKTDIFRLSTSSNPSPVQKDSFSRRN